MQSALFLFVSVSIDGVPHLPFGDGYGDWRTYDEQDAADYDT